MHTIAIKLRSERLSNPDADIRYTLPDLLAQRSGGVISDDGYDYVGESNDLVIFLQVSDLEKATACVQDVITSLPVLGNDPRHAAVVAVEQAGRYDIVYPPNSQEEFRI